MLLINSSPTNTSPTNVFVRTVVSRSLFQKASGWLVQLSSITVQAKLNLLLNEVHTILMAGCQSCNQKSGSSMQRGDF